MTDRITKHVSAMKEYGRKPYLVTKDSVPIGEKADYRYMMETTWHKAQDNEQIIVQSVKKKPYKSQDYQAMETGLDTFQPFMFPELALKFDWNFPTFNFDWRKPNPFPANQEALRGKNVEEVDNKIYSKFGRHYLSITQCPSNVSGGNTYQIIVKNSYVTVSYVGGGRILNTVNQYFPSYLSLDAQGGATGQYLSNIVFNNSVTTAMLNVNSGCDGNYVLTVSDGSNNYDSKIIYGYTELDCSGNPSSIEQSDTISLSVTGGTESSISWSVSNVGNSYGASVSGSGRSATLSTSADAIGSWVVTVTDGKSICYIYVSCVEGNEGLDPNAADTTEGWEAIRQDFKDNGATLSGFYLKVGSSRPEDIANSAAGDLYTACTNAYAPNGINCCNKTGGYEYLGNWGGIGIYYHRVDFLQSPTCPEGGGYSVYFYFVKDSDLGRVTGSTGTHIRIA